MLPARCPCVLTSIRSAFVQALLEEVDLSLRLEDSYCGRVDGLKSFQVAHENPVVEALALPVIVLGHKKCNHVPSELIFHTEGILDHVCCESVMFYHARILLNCVLFQNIENW